MPRMHTMSNRHSPYFRIPCVYQPHSHEHCMPLEAGAQFSTTSHADKCIITCTCNHVSICTLDIFAFAIFYCSNEMCECVCVGSSESNGAAFTTYDGTIEKQNDESRIRLDYLLGRVSMLAA